MVFVTVGTPTQGFPRLLEVVDQLAGGGFFDDEPVFMQTGSTRDFVPRHCNATAFVPRPQFEGLLMEARLIICHGGVTLLEMIRLGKVPVVMPRRKKYGEHVNDHQLELVELLASEGRIVAAWEPRDLRGAVVDARRRTAWPVAKSEIASLVDTAVQELTWHGMRR